MSPPCGVRPSGLYWDMRLLRENAGALAAALGLAGLLALYFFAQRDAGLGEQSVPVETRRVFAPNPRPEAPAAGETPSPVAQAPLPQDRLPSPPPASAMRLESPALAAPGEYAAASGLRAPIPPAAGGSFGGAQPSNPTARPGGNGDRKP